LSKEHLSWTIQTGEHDPVSNLKLLLLFAVLLLLLLLLLLLFEYMFYVCMHACVCQGEDARAAMMLYRKYRDEWEKCLRLAKTAAFSHTAKTNTTDAPPPSTAMAMEESISAETDDPVSDHDDNNDDNGNDGDSDNNDSKS
jgi:hypothetical protein